MTFNHGEPVYQVIATDIKNKIHQGELKPSDLLPSENMLAQTYETSRVTARKSLQLLEQDGYIYSWPGKGYFVSKPRHDIFTLVYNEVSSMHDVDYKKITVVEPDQEVQDALDISGKQQVIKICRVIKKDEQAIALDVKYLPYDKGKPLVEVEMRYADFPKIVAAKAMPFAFHARMEISAEIVDQETANMLKCKENTAVLTIKRFFISRSKKRIGYGKIQTLMPYGVLEAYSGYPNDQQ